MTSKPPPWYTKHCEDTLAYGPLPAGIDVTGTSDAPAYHVTIGKKPRTFSHHPLSPRGREEWGSLLASAPAEEGKKADCRGVAHPSFVYKPGEWLWETDDEPKQVLIKALQLSNVQVTLKDFTAEKTEAVEDLMSKRAELYHPRDREDLSPFHDEHRYSCWARQFGRGLYIVGHEIQKDGRDWRSFQNTAANQRTAVRARQSTGEQDEFPPIILGCIPISSASTKWFVLLPTEAMMTPFENNWRR
jgi:hypothetical protein